MKNRGELNTEKQNIKSKDIDSLNLDGILRLINKEDMAVASAVGKAIPKIEQVVGLTTLSLRSGGRIFYVGAGTSGRLGVLDASEIPPTFSASKNCFIGIIAGGDLALRNSVEGAEDNFDQAIIDLQDYNLNDKDVVIGISCSGAAKYVISALEYAGENGAKTIYIITNPKPFKSTKVNILVMADTGPEIITGSTRMKAGTATKMILNMISTATMISLGKVYGNLMVDLMAVNEKLLDRGARIIVQLTNLNYLEAKKKLHEAEKSVKIAIVMEKLNCSIQEAKRVLEKENGFLRRIIKK